MKKRVLSLIAALVLTTSMLFANTGENRIPEAVSSAFSTSFTNAQDVRWEGIGEYYKATFEQNGRTNFVFYTYDAEIMGIANNILSDNLPEVSLTDIKSRYSDYWITNLVKYNVAGKTGFLLTLENASEKLVMETMDNGHWKVHSKKAKA